VPDALGSGIQLLVDSRVYAIASNQDVTGYRSVLTVEKSGDIPLILIKADTFVTETYCVRT
jgi:hypothetical protein